MATNNPNAEIRAALADPDYLLSSDMEADLDEEVEALLCGFDCHSVPFAEEAGPIKRPDFLGAAVEALADDPDLLYALVGYYTDLNRDDAANWRDVSGIVEPLLEKIARRMILTAWLGGEDD